MTGIFTNRAKRQSARGLLVHQIDVTLEGLAFALGAVVAPPIGDAEERANARASIAEIEHEGDDARSELSRVMLSRVVTPLDREDLFRASRSIDDVLNNTRDFVREMTMWRATGGSSCENGLQEAVSSLEKLREAVLLTDASEARNLCAAARKEAGKIRRSYQQGLKDLFAGELTMETLKTRDLLRRLDVIGLRLAEAADALLDGFIKRAL
ncbi:MAG: DUF47 family protein [Ruaniaceae bacterium]|nr:DUF47 family protein [Ruaniaceae bacterium]